MCKLNSGFCWTCSIQIERKVGSLTFKLEQQDSDLQQYRNYI